MAAKYGAAREIALAFGVPPMLLGIPGDNTYSNYQEANRAFWRQTVLPLLGRLAEALGHWLAPAFTEDGHGGGLRLWFDADQVEALSSEREALWARVGAAQALVRAFTMIGISLYTPAHHAAGNLWFERPGSGCGFPVSRSARDLLVGGDAKYF